MIVWLNGGPVLRVMKYQICNLQGRPSNRMIVAIRAAITWLPAVMILGMFVMLLVMAESQTTHIEPEVGSIGEYLKNSKVVLVGIVMFFAAFSSLMVGMLFAVLSPKRGLVDFLLRTCLLPR